MNEYTMITNLFVLSWMLNIMKLFFVDNIVFMIHLYSLS